MISLLVVATLAVQSPQQAASPTVEGTVDAVSAVAVKVARTKSELDQFRRAVYNDPGGVVLMRANEMRTACDSLVAVIERRERDVCRNCMTSRAQASVNAYRAYMPSLARAGRQCSTRIAQLRASRSGNADSAAARMRREFQPISTSLIDALRAYEQRLEGVRRVFGPNNAPVQGRPSR